MLELAVCKGFCLAFSPRGMAFAPGVILQSYILDDDLSSVSSKVTSPSWMLDSGCLRTDHRANHATLESYCWILFLLRRIETGN